MSTNPILDTVKQWVEPVSILPSNTKWRWILDDKQKVTFTTDKLKINEKTNSSLIKVFKAMEKSLSSLPSPKELLISPDTQNSLEKFRNCVEERYNKYCNAHCFFTRIFEIFLSIFPGRTSTWAEHRKLINRIDNLMGKTVRDGQVDLDPTAVKIRQIIQKELNSWTHYPLTPCCLLAGIGLKDKNNGKISRLCRLNKLYDTNSNPEEFVGLIEKKLNEKLANSYFIDDEKNFSIIVEKLIFTKTSANQSNLLDISFKRITYSNPGFGYFPKEWNNIPFSKLGELDIKRYTECIKLTNTIVDANGNFVPQLLDD